MTKITNANREGGASVDFTLPAKKGGTVKVESLRPGESRNIDISADDPQVVALLHTRQITLGNDRPVVPTPPKKEVSGA